jgi:hypothetical protein
MVKTADVLPAWRSSPGTYTRYEYVATPGGVATRVKREVDRRRTVSRR